MNKQKRLPRKGPGQNARLRNTPPSLWEKHDAQMAYGLMEAQFRNAFEKPGHARKTGENLFILLERRLDNGSTECIRHLLAPRRASRSITAISP